DAASDQNPASANSVHEGAGRKVQEYAGQGEGADKQARGRVRHAELKGIARQHRQYEVPVEENRGHGDRGDDQVLVLTYEAPRTLHEVSHSKNRGTFMLAKT